MAKLICGCGYLGLRVANRWLASGAVVWATTRSTQRAAELEALGIKPIIADVTRRFVLPSDGNDIDTVIFAVGFDRSPGQDIEQVYVRGLEHVLGGMNDRLQRFIYVSSTGVYEESRGQWVDEETPSHPLRAGGRACLQAERRLAESAFADRRIVLRLAGLYGPGRLPKLAAVQTGEPIESTEDGYLNLIHIDDAAEIVSSTEDWVSPPATILVADGNPVRRGDFYRELARQLNAPPPRFAPPQATSSAGERGSTDKRVSNRKLISIYPRPLSYPSYREGLASIVAVK